MYARDRAVLLLLHFALVEQVGEDVRSVLVVGSILLRLRELLLQLLDLIFPLVLEDVGELLTFKLVVQLGLRSATL